MRRVILSLLLCAVPHLGRAQAFDGVGYLQPDGVRVRGRLVVGDDSLRFDSERLRFSLPFATVDAMFVTHNERRTLGTVLAGGWWAKEDQPVLNVEVVSGDSIAVYAFATNRFVDVGNAILAHVHLQPRRRVATAAVAASPGPPADAAPAVAADSLTAAPGAEVRLTTRAGRVIRGHLATDLPDSVRIRVKGASGELVVAAIPRDSVAWLEVNHPGAPRTAVGALVGLGSGALVGAVIAFENCPVFCTLQQQRQANTDFTIAIVAGGVLGALVGSGIRPAHWRQVPSERIGMTVRSAGGGVGVGLSLRF